MRASLPSLRPRFTFPVAMLFGLAILAAACSGGNSGGGNSGGGKK